MMISNSVVGGVYYWSNVVIKGVILGYMFGSGIRLSGPIFPAQILDPTSRSTLNIYDSRPFSSWWMLMVYRNSARTASPERRAPHFHVKLFLWNLHVRFDCDMPFDKLARHLSVLSGIPIDIVSPIDFGNLCGRKFDMFNLGAARPREPMNSRFFV
jgi:hypothetical protein